MPATRASTHTIAHLRPWAYGGTSAGWLGHKQRVSLYPQKSAQTTSSQPNLYLILYPEHSGYEAQRIWSWLGLSSCLVICVFPAEMRFYCSMRDIPQTADLVVASTSKRSRQPEMRRGVPPANWCRTRESLQGYSVLLTLTDPVL
jgi:hypothetical protein